MTQIIKLLPGYEDVLIYWASKQKIKYFLYSFDMDETYVKLLGLTKKQIADIEDMGITEQITKEKEEWLINDIFKSGTD